MKHAEWPAQGQSRLTEDGVQARMDALPDEAVALAEDVWTEDEPTVAEYELMRDVLASDWMRNDQQARAREAEVRTALGLQAWIQHERNASYLEVGGGPYQQGRFDALDDLTRVLRRACGYCSDTGRSCIPLWSQGRKCCPDCIHGKPPPLARPRRPGTCWICGEPAVDDELQCDRHGESA